MSASKITVHRVSKVKGKERIADYCGRNIRKLGSKSAAKKAISAGKLFLNGSKVRTADYVTIGDVIELRGSLHRNIKRIDIQIPTVFEDEHLLIVNKPAGIAVNGNRYKTVENALADANNANNLVDALPRPIAAHRLDVPTCGLVILAKTKSAQIKINRAFQENRISKTYEAIVHGMPGANGQVNSSVNGKEALTKFELIRHVRSKVFSDLCLLALSPITGRTHQLRIHMHRIGHLIVGDKMYAEGQKTIFGKGLMLCACRLQFEHPITQQPMKIQIKPPAKFTRILDREEKRFAI